MNLLQDFILKAEQHCLNLSSPRTNELKIYASFACRNCLNFAMKVNSFVNTSGILVLRATFWASMLTSSKSLSTDTSMKLRGSMDTVLRLASIRNNLERTLRNFMIVFCRRFTAEKQQNKSKIKKQKPKQQKLNRFTLKLSLKKYIPNKQIRTTIATSILFQLSKRS